MRTMCRACGADRKRTGQDGAGVAIPSSFRVGTWLGTRLGRGRRSLLLCLEVPEEFCSGNRVGMIVAEDLASPREAFTNEPKSTFDIALRPQCRSQIVLRRQRVRMFLAQHARHPRQRALPESSRPCVIALRQER